MDNFVKSVWISANAGSGKTYTLTARVVRLLLLGVPPERIVCITFTKAAASEMRSRVLDSLRMLLLADEATCRTKIEELLGAPADASMLAHARRLFAAVLDSPSGGLQLTTIHGFCQNLLRRFPMEARIAPHFTVLEDTAAADMLRLAKHRLLAQFASGDAALEQAFTLIGERSGEYRFDALMADIISKRGRWEEIWRGQSGDSLREHLFALHGLAADASEASLTEALCGLPNEADAAVMRGYLAVMLAHKKKTEQKFGIGFAAWLEKDEAARVDAVNDLCALLLTDKQTLRADVAKLENAADTNGVILRFADAVVHYRAQCAALACAQESFAIAVLARGLLELYEQAKAEAHALDYDDLIEKTVVLCSHPESLGWVMSKLDHRIDHLLVDEAQDTSSRQWKLAVTLVEELMASTDGVGSAGQPRSLLVVGDEKQSIYSFQGAAPELFSQHEDVFAAMLNGGPSPLGTVALSTSYRSAEAVLRLVDHIAEMAPVRAALSARGQVQPHLLHHKDMAGYVALHPLIAAPEKVAVAPMQVPVEYQITKTAAALLADHIATTLADWLAQGRVLKSAGRAMQPGDILILVRSRRPLVLPLIRALQHKGIPVAGLDRLMLADHLAVRDLLALMAWCMNVSDDLALAQVLRSPLIGFSDEALRAAAFARPASLWAQVEHPLLTRALEQRQASPYDFLTDILEVQGARARFAARFGAEVHEVLDELKAQAAAMPASLPCTLANFYDWLHGSSAQVKREQETGQANLVCIMTVHGAKGLEAPVVLLADTISMPTTQHERMFFVTSPQAQPLPVLSLSPAAKSAPLLVQAKQDKAAALTAEYYRLLYVALTRAREELHVFGASEAKPECWYGIIAAAMQSLDAQNEEGILSLRDVRVEKPFVSNWEVLPDAMPVPLWAREAPAALHASTPLVAPSRMLEMQVSPYAQSGVAGAKERGVRIHRVLELLRPESNAAHITRLVAQIGPDWTVTQKAEVAAEVITLFAQERWLWSAGSMPEVSITGTIEVAGQNVAINGQIDVLVVTENEVVIVDYKTGRHVPETAAQVSANYLIQLKTYVALVAQLYPEKNVRCAIVWTSMPQLMWLDQAVKTAEFPKQNVMLKTA